MDCNREEAMRAKEIAEKKMESKDFVGAQKIAMKAKQLYPDIENISQLLLVCDVHCSATKKLMGGDLDWYGILQVEKTADDVVIKKQYRKFALQLHPDKNKFFGAEGAFKLIGEAQRILLDKEKRRIHDMRNVPVSYRPQRYTNVVPATNRSHPPTPNFYNLQSQQPAQPGYVDPNGAFWTICPFCSVRYQYLNDVLNRALRCQNCAQPFIAYDMNIASAANFAKPVFPQQQMNNTHKMGAQFHKQFVPRDSKAASVQNAGKRVDHTTPNAGTGKVDRKKEKKRARDQSELSESELSYSSSDSEKEMKVDQNGDVQGGRNSGYPEENVRRSSRRKQHVSYKENVSDGDDDDAKEGYDQASERAKGKRSSDSTKEENGGESKEESVKVNSQSNFGAKTKKDGEELKQKVGDDEELKEKAGDGEELKQKVGDDEEFKQKVGDGEELKQKVGDGEECLPNGNKTQNREGLKDPVEERGSKENFEVHVDIDSSSEEEEETLDSLLSYPDPDFSNFDIDRETECFKAGQIWAAYDDQGAMPRFYAMIKKVFSPGFKLHIIWLEPDPDDKNEKKWHSENLPLSCGKFRFGNPEKTDNHPMFSHVMAWEQGISRHTFVIHPRQGETWAVFKNWDIKWSCDPDAHRKNGYDYEFVVILSNYTRGAGIYVGLLTKVEGFVSLFCRTETVGKNTFIVPPGELLRFSHKIPCYKLTGEEREGVPKDSFELDPAALPVELVSSPSKDDAKDRDTKRSHLQTEENDSDLPSASAPGEMEIPDSNFFNFDDEKSDSKFQVGQVWALYSDEDGLPKYYGQIERVKTSPVFNVRVLWLAFLAPENYIGWNYDVMPDGCGTFQVLKGSSQTYKSRSSFSHLVKFETTRKKNELLYRILPKKDQVWALYKNWRADMKPSDLENCEYDIVEVLGDNNMQIEVLLLDRMAKFNSVFKPRGQGGSDVTKRRISHLELVKFSHQIPAFRLTQENGGRLRGFWEVDTAALPIHYFSSN